MKIILPNSSRLSSAGAGIDCRTLLAKSSQFLHQGFQLRQFRTCKHCHRRLALRAYGERTPGVGVAGQHQIAEQGRPGRQIVFPAQQCLPPCIRAGIAQDIMQTAVTWRREFGIRAKWQIDGSIAQASPASA
ncbi:hypothetical protein [Noviherbaspirillum malthae]|uniref:hypothetical protein n=1 Tax=Noviherbaspirillum malthae TaxID=1260987 RepID=UPI001E61F7D0|nr:hypothetical protein [Noviherbaspirillum malthae]